MTLNAHRLVSKAYELAGSAVQSALFTLIFRAYCEDDLDINDYEVLADAAEQSGAMSKVEVSMPLLCCGCWRLLGFLHFHLLRGWRSVFESDLE
jgi:predicted DsbA family dithiol-disulfide isomerase